MKRNELNELLLELAVKDLSDDADFKDHPCVVAVRAIDKAFNDIETLCKVIRDDKVNKSKVIHGFGRSKKVQTLIGLPYNPSW